MHLLQPDRQEPTGRHLQPLDVLGRQSAAEYRDETSFVGLSFLTKKAD
jgi:hypothetical protein